jgi:hypothetical protein
VQTVHLIILEHACTLSCNGTARTAVGRLGFQQITPTLGTAHPPSWGVMPTEQGKAWARERS